MRWQRTAASELPDASVPRKESCPGIFSVNPPAQHTYLRVDEIPKPDRPAAPLPPDRQEEFVRLLNAAHALLLRYIMSMVGNRHDARGRVAKRQRGDVAALWHL